MVSKNSLISKSLKFRVGHFLRQDRKYPQNRAKAEHRIAPRVNAFLASPGTATRSRLPGPDPATLLGDVIDQSGVAAAVKQMKLAIDGGRQVHARVLSGVGYGHPTKNDVPDPNEKKPQTLHKAPPEEHSLVIIGYDGDTFVFADPDAHVSHQFGGGFGLLHFDRQNPNRLSTASDSLDLFVTPPEGLHARGDKRYQVIRLASFE
jgi:hypothetical protein